MDCERVWIFLCLRVGEGGVGNLLFRCFLAGLVVVNGSALLVVVKGTILLYHMQIASNLMHATTGK